MTIMMAFIISTFKRHLRLNYDMFYYYASILHSFKNLTVYPHGREKHGQNFKYGQVYSVIAPKKVPTSVRLETSVTVSVENSKQGLNCM